MWSRHGRDACGQGMKPVCMIGLGMELGHVILDQAIKQIDKHHDKIFHDGNNKLLRFIFNTVTYI